MLTLDAVAQLADVDVLEHLDRQVDVPVLAGPQAQGDVLVLPTTIVRGATSRLPAGGVPVVRGENGGNTHHLIAVGPVCGRADPGHAHHPGRLPGLPDPPRARRHRRRARHLCAAPPAGAGRRGPPGRRLAPMAAARMVRPAPASPGAPAAPPCPDCGGQLLACVAADMDRVYAELPPEYHGHESLRPSLRTALAQHQAAVVAVERAAEALLPPDVRAALDERLHRIRTYIPRPT